MATISSARPSWQRSPVFKFFASLKLAVVLLAVLIVAAIAGTIWESSFDAKVARAYVYRAPWFNLWLILLGANLTVSALSRWPWRKHHVAFLVTHLGIITLLTGSLIGRIFGIEGTMTLFKGDPPSNRLLIDEHQLRVHDSDGVLKGYRAEFLHRPPTPKHPRDLGKLASGARLSVIDYAEAIDAKLNPRQLDSGGTPALHFTIKTAMMGQQLESWLLADDAQNGKFAMGLANIELKRGKAEILKPGHPGQSDATSGDPGEVTSQLTQRDPSNSLGMTDLEESIFVFAKKPEQISHVAKGGGTGAKISFSPPQNGDKGQLTISLAEKRKLSMSHKISKGMSRLRERHSLRELKTIGPISGFRMGNRFRLAIRRIILRSSSPFVAAGSNCNGGPKCAWKRADRFNQRRAFNHSEHCPDDERSERCGKSSHAFRC